MAICKTSTTIEATFEARIVGNTKGGKERLFLSSTLKRSRLTANENERSQGICNDTSVSAEIHQIWKHSRRDERTDFLVMPSESRAVCTERQERAKYLYLAYLFCKKPHKLESYYTMANRHRINVSAAGIMTAEQRRYIGGTTHSTTMRTVSEAGRSSWSCVAILTVSSWSPLLIF